MCATRTTNMGEGAARDARRRSIKKLGLIENDDGAILYCGRISKQNSNRFENNTCIKRERLLFQVLIVECELMQKGETRRAIDLREPSHARNRVDQVSIFGWVANDFFGFVWAWANEREFAAEHVPQLWEFIDAEFAQDFPNACESGIMVDFKKWSIGTFVLRSIPMFQIVCASDHRTKFICVNDFSV